MTNVATDPVADCGCVICQRQLKAEADADAALEAYKARLDDQAVLEKTADAIIEAHED